MKWPCSLIENWASRARQCAESLFARDGGIEIARPPAPRRRGEYRVLARSRQAGFVRLSMLMPRWGAAPFRVQDGFRNGEPGAHFETYDPNTLLRRRNRLTYSEQFDNAAWIKTAILSTTANSDGTGDLVVPTTAAALHFVTQANASVGTSNIVRVRAKAGGYSWIFIQIGNGGVYFNVSTGVVGTNTASTTSAYTPAVSAAADAAGYYDCTVSVIAAQGVSVNVFVASADGVVSYAGDGTSGIYLARAQLEWNTTTASEYQLVTDWNTEYVAAAGSANIYMWQDSAGTTPVTGIEQPVGKWVDRSGNGKHATQATAASRGTLSARYNLLTKSEQFDDTAVWPNLIAGTGVAPVRTANYATAPNGTTTADRIQLNLGGGTTSGDRSAFNATGIATTTGASYKGGIYLKATDAGNVGKKVIFRHVAGGAYTTHTLTDSWVLVTATEVAAGATSTFAIELRGANGLQDTADFLIWGADLRTSNDAALSIPAYQRVNTISPADYDTDGFVHFLRFDGTDDSYATPSIDFSGVDKMFISAVLTKLSDTATGIVSELTTSVTANNGSFYVAAPGGAGVNTIAAASKGTTGQTVNANSLVAPLTSMFAALMDIAGDSLAVRHNGAQSGSNTNDQGTGNFSNAVLYIGRRGGSSIPFSGRLTSLTVRGTTTPTSNRFIRDMEQWAARLAGQVFSSTF